MTAESSRSHEDADLPRDRNGLTEEEFLAAYVEKDYPKPSLTADICVFRRVPDGLELLLVRRGGHPYLGCWALPGGFVKKGEDADTAAARELAEETGVEGLALEQVGFYSTPGRDPRGWIVSEAYLSVDGEGRSAQAGDDAADAAWFALTVADDDSAEAGEAAGGSRAQNGSAQTSLAQSGSAQTSLAQSGSTQTSLPQSGSTRMTLKHDDAELGITLVARPQASSGRLRAEIVDSAGLAFDHARIIGDAYLAMKR